MANLDKLSCFLSTVIIALAIATLIGIKIGWRWYVKDATFGGQIDEVHVHDYALNATEMWAAWLRAIVKRMNDG